jgi:carbon-monoxide dehydrogenase iron sulfur subunit
MLSDCKKHIPGISVKTDAAGALSIPVKCRHCNPAPCINACLAGAIQRDFCTGFVIIDEEQCTGCKRCLNACPFNVIGFGFSQQSGNEHETAVKCDECIEIVRGGADPACVKACKSGALQFCDADETFREKRVDAINQLKGNVKKHSQCNYALFFSLKNTNR